MPEYLSPGVYVEELPPQLRAIEGVSTSTAGFVGVTQRGPAPGFPLPFEPQPTDPQVVTLVPDPTPVLVTSFSEFMRQFGPPLPLPDPNDNSYLGYAIQGFFANGGLRAYIARVVHIDQTTPANSSNYGGLCLNQGMIYRLVTSFTATTTNPSTDNLTFASVRGISNGMSLTLFNKDGTAVSPAVVVTVKSYDNATGQVFFTSSIATSLAAGNAYAMTTGSDLTSGPFFWARSPGSWSSQVSVAITPSRRRGVVAGPAAAAAMEIPVASTSGFYVGAIVELDLETQLLYAEVAAVGSGSLTLTVPLGTAVPAPDPNGFSPTARITEIDVTLTDTSTPTLTTETFTNLTWNPSPQVTNRHYATVINAQSTLVYVQPPGVGTVNGVQFAGSESAAFSSQPTTFNGLACSISSLKAAMGTAVEAVTQALDAISTAINTVNGDIASAIAAPPPISAAASTTFTNDIATLTSAIAAATALPLPGATAALAGTITSVTAAANLALTTANAALTTATTNPAGAIASLTSDQTSIAADLLTIDNAIAAASYPFVVGEDAYSAISDDDYIGVDNGPGHRSGIQALLDVDEISIISAPGRSDQTIQNELIDQCELLRYRFAVLDGEHDPAGGGSVNAILAHRQNYDSSYAGYYAPWFQLTLNNQNVYVPPSGHIIGIYAGTDNSRGVWKAPANVVVQNITGLKYYLNKGEQDILNPEGVNLTRKFHTTGTRVWGARTISSDPSLIYVNVRRTLIFLEASIDQGTQWVVFEPNTPDTWDRLTDSVSAFLLTQWREGALFGLKPEDSFFVRCDETTMTADDIQNGRLICLIGVAIVRPAEFVIFRIEQTTGYANQ